MKNPPLASSPHAETQLGTASGPPAPADRPAYWLLGFAALSALTALIATQLFKDEGGAAESYAIFERLFIFHDGRNALAVTLALLGVTCISRARDAGTQLVTVLSAHPLATCIATFCLLAVGSRFVYLAHPLAMDEYAPLLQSHAFANGSLTIQYPVELLDQIVLPRFQNYFIAVNRSTGEVASMYWPGLALLLTPFTIVGAPWLLNPLLGAVSLWFVARLAVQVGGTHEAAGWAMLFTLASPQFTVTAMSLYAMPGLLLTSVVYAWLLFRPGLRSSMLAGVVGSIGLVLHNPVPHILVAIPFVCYLLIKKDRWPRLLAMACGYLPIAIVLGMGWPYFLSALQAASSPAAVISGAEHWIARWLAKASNVFAFPNEMLLAMRVEATIKLVLWSAPGLLLLWSVCMRSSRHPLAKLLTLTTALTFGLYLFVPYDQGHGWGYRYLHSTWATLPILGAVAAATPAFAVSLPAWRQACGSLAVAGLLATPIFWLQVRSFIASELSHRMPPPADGNWVVFVAEESSQYRADLVQNFPDRQRVLFLVSRGLVKDEELLRQRFPQAALRLADHRGSLWAVPSSPWEASVR